MGVARIQAGERPIREQVVRRPNRAGRAAAVAVSFLILTGSASPTYDDPATRPPVAVATSESSAPESTSQSAQSWAGFGGVPITEPLSQRLGLPSAGGIIVTFVHPEGPAAKVGLYPKDMVLRAAGEPIVDGAGWSEWIADQSPGTTIELSVLRQGNVLTLLLTVDELPENMEPVTI